MAQEAACWTTTIDSAGQTLNGQHDYVLHFPAGQLPPNDAGLAIGRVLVYSDSDLPIADGLAKLIQLAPLSSN